MTVKKTLLASLAINLLAGSIAYSAEMPPFKDVKPEDWYYMSIVNLKEKGIIKGYSDKTFKADRKLTYAEFITMLNTLLFGKDENVKEIWYKDAFDRFLEYNVLDDRKTIYENADTLITREEAAVILSRTLENIKNTPPDYRENKFPDLSDTSFENLDYI